MTCLRVSVNQSCAQIERFLYTSAQSSGRVSEFQRDSVDEAIFVEDDGHLAADRIVCCIDCRPRGE